MLELDKSPDALETFLKTGHLRGVITMSVTFVILEGDMIEESDNVRFASGYDTLLELEELLGVTATFNGENDD